MIRSEPLALRVRQVEPLAPTLKRVVLESADGGLLPSAPPGAHLRLTLPAGTKNHRNSYSIVSGPDERARYELVIRRTENSRGGSAFIHEALRPHDVLSAAVPNSQFPVQNLARKHLLIGGGIGITPLLSLLPVLRARQARLELHQFARPPEVSVFETLLAPFAGRDIAVHGGRRSLALVDLLARQPLGTHVYCCGPEALMDAVQATARALGWPASRIHGESFGAAGGNPFTVTLARSGQTLSVGEHDSMLEALENAGIPVSSLCRGGACGECLTEVLDGAPDHRDHFLSADEKAGNRLVMPCVSRAKTPGLTLAL